MNSFSYYTLIFIGLLFLGTSTTTHCQQDKIDSSKVAPLDDLYKKEDLQNKPVLVYDDIQEKDVLWEKRVWREIMVEEKMNHHFKYEKAYLINILLAAIKDKKITAYYPIDDKFSSPIPYEEAKILGTSIDTIIPCFADDYDQWDESVMTVENNLNPTDLKKYRLKEVWFFDEEAAKLDVRILGIAPIVDHYDDNGNYLASLPMFWAYYPELRKVLATKKVFNPANDISTMSWADLFDNRLFSSHIVKESNTADKRIKDYKNSSLDVLLEADKIKAENFNFEHDLWSY